MLILSIDSFNATRAELVTMLPITSVARPANPFRIGVAPPEGGLVVDSYIIGEQVRTITTRRLVRRLGAVSPATLARVAGVVRMLLGL